MYSFERKITIDNTKVPNTDQANFPVLVSGVYSYLKTVGNGGNVTNANGYDIIFTSDSAGIVPLDFEIEYYNGVTGEVDFWVHLPLVKTALPTVFYMLYGNAAIVTSQENILGVWDANYKRVYHLNDNAANTIVKDSTANGNGTSSVNTSTLHVSGQVDGAMDFSAALDYVTGAPITPANISWECWINQAYIVGSTESGIVDTTDGGGNPILSIQAFGNNIYLAIGGSFIGFAPAISTGTWYHLVATWDGSTYHLYINGVEASVVAVGGYGPDDAILMIATLSTGTNAYNFGGTIDEVRLSDSIRSADWAATAYNNQNSPSSFYSILPVALPNSQGELSLLSVGN